MVPDPHLFRFDAQLLQPVNAELLPVCKPFQVRIRFAEKLQFHLLKLPGPESEVAGRNLVAEGFADLPDSERDFLSGSALYVLEVYKNALGRFGTQIYGALGVLRHALEGLEHQVELTDIRKIVLAAGRAGNIMLLNEVHHLFLAPAVHGPAQVNAVFRGKIFNHLIRPEALMAFPAVHQRIGKSAQMPGRNPCLGIHQDGAVHAHIVRIFLNEFLPPGTLYIILKLHAQVAVIPCIGKTSVNLGSGINESSGFCQRHNFLH